MKKLYLGDKLTGALDLQLALKRAGFRAGSSNFSYFMELSDVSRQLSLTVL